MSRQPCSEGMLTHMALIAALQAGDLDDARQALGDPPDFPNCVDPYLHSSVLSLALGPAAPATIKRLLEMGANPDFDTGDGFPALVETILTNRPDRIEILNALLDAGADIELRGTNHWTPLQAAAAANDAEAVRLLLGRGADVTARTIIDDNNTALEEAEMLGSMDAAAVLRAHLENQ